MGIASAAVGWCISTAQKFPVNSGMFLFLVLLDLLMVACNLICRLISHFEF